MKASLTFNDGIDYLLWKIARHTGIEVTASPDNDATLYCSPGHWSGACIGLALFVNQMPETSPPQRNLGFGQRLWKNFASLLGGRALGAVLALLATAMLARALPLADFGLLVMMHTLALFVRGLCNLRPFDTIVRYGVAHESESAGSKGLSDPVSSQPRETLNPIADLLVLTRSIDLVAALSAALLAWGAARWISPMLGASPEWVALGQWYAPVLLAAGTGTAKGLLRLHNRYGTLGISKFLAPFARVLGIGLCWYLQAPISGYVLAMALGLLAENSFLHWHGAQLRRRFHTNTVLTAPLLHPDFKSIGVNNPGIYPFMRAMYWQSNLDLLPKRAAVLVAGAVLGPAGAGVFRIASDLASLLTEPAILVRQAVFPDLARLWQQSGQLFFRKLAQLCGILLLSAATLAALLGYFAVPLLSGIAGPAFTVGAPLLIWLLWAGALDVTNGALRTGVFSSGAAGSMVTINTLASGVYLTLLWTLLSSLGLVGAGYASFLSAVLSILGAVFLLGQRRAGLPKA